MSSDGVVAAPSIAVVFESETPRVLSYRLMKHSDDIAAYASALYDAFAGQRTPAQHRAAGLRWDVPQHIEVAGEALSEVLMAPTATGAQPEAAGLLSDHKKRANPQYDKKGRRAVSPALSVAPRKPPPSCGDNLHRISTHQGRAIS